MADSLFTTGVDEPEADYNDGIANGVAVTVHFPRAAGTITHVRFRAPANVSAGSYQAAVWEITGPDTAPSGIRLTDVLTFPALQPSAWNLLEIPGGLPVARGGPGGKAYRVIVYSSLGRYTARNAYFAADGKTSPGGYVHAPHNGDDPVGLGALSQGTYAYVPAGAYVADTFGASNYYIDVVFEPAATPPLLAGIAETITVVDTVGAAAAYARHLAAATAVTGTAAAPALALTRAGNAALTLTGVAATAVTGGRTSADTLALGATTGRSLTQARPIAATLALGTGARATVFRSAATAATLTLTTTARRSPHLLARPAAAALQLTARAQGRPIPTAQPVPHAHRVVMTVAVPGRIDFTAGPGVTA